MKNCFVVKVKKHKLEPTQKLNESAEAQIKTTVEVFCETCTATSYICYFIFQKKWRIFFLECFFFQSMLVFLIERF